MEEVRLLLPRRGMEDLGRGLGFGELVAPGGLEIDGGCQGQDGAGVHAEPGGLVLQQVSGLLVQPVPQGLVVLRGAHGPPEAGGVVVPCQHIHGFLHVADPVAEPEGGGQQAGHGAVIPVKSVPQGLDPGPERSGILLPQEGEDLGPALPVRHLRQHGQGHIDVQRSADAVFHPRAGEELRQTGTKISLQPVRVARRLILLGPDARLPGGPRLLRTFGIGVGSHFRIYRPGQSRVSGVFRRKIRIFRRIRFARGGGCVGGALLRFLPIGLRRDRDFPAGAEGQREGQKQKTGDQTVHE